VWLVSNTTELLKVQGFDQAMKVQVVTYPSVAKQSSCYSAGVMCFGVQMRSNEGLIHAGM